MAQLELELETEGPEAEVPESKHSAHSSLTLVLLAMDRLVNDELGLMA